MFSIPAPLWYLAKQTQQYIQASWRWKRLRFDAPPIFGNARAKSGSHLLLQVLQGIWSALPYAYVRQAPVRMITPEGRHRAPKEILRELQQIRAGIIGWGYLSPTQENIQAVCRPGTVNYFIYRDPRDMLISHIFYAMDMHEKHRLRAYYLKLPDMPSRLMATIRGIDEPGFEYPNVRVLYEDVLRWLKQPSVMAIRFEDLRNKPRPVIRAMLERIREAGLEFTSEDDARVDKVMGAIKPSESPTFRQGKSGGWKEFFSEEHKKVFKDIAGDLLIELGYETSNDW